MIPEISSIEIAQLASGDCLSIQVYKFCGATPGKKAYLQANLHGAEIVGNAVVQQLFEFFSDLDKTQLQGEIWMVPACNPLATNQRSHHFSSGRYNPYDGTDWNRIFWDYEKQIDDIEDFARTQLDFDTKTIRKNFLDRILQEFSRLTQKIDAPSSVPFDERYRYTLQSLCIDADYVIDIHSSTNRSIDYLYCFQTREESAKYFLLNYGILLNEYDGDAFDEAFLKPWLALEKQLEKLGKSTYFDIESWTLELGSGMEMNPDSVYRGVRGIKNYLTGKKMLDLSGFPLVQTLNQTVYFFSKSQFKKYYASRGGIVQSRVILGTIVKPGQLLYQLLVITSRSPKVVEVRAEKAGMVFDLSTNHAVNQGEYVLSIWEQAR
ncbi:MAG: succinylglutamate desuccinylase/aspartoacylase family protein [Cyanobacteria bacterium SID2]|nr:succinylglutamate desuccinylase/aspartoacylase family protein [Cyanobacteria bacterium SID2]MBP0004928.1 succinylglutamate desuccinylase/aspartoacylase family protein [Cyanobacteria bacterium SBC]